MIKNTNYYKMLLNIAIPVSIQSLIQSSLNMIDQFMIGTLGKEAIAAVGVGSRPLFIMFYILMGVSGGASIFISQYWGKKDTKNTAQALGLTIILGAVVSVFFTIFSLSLPDFFLQFFTKDKKVIELGESYLRYTSLGFIPMMLVVAYSAVLRSSGHARIPMYAGLFTVLANTLLNYLLIFGNFGFPAMGVKGAAIATSIARLSEFLIILFIIYYKKLPGAFKLRELVAIKFDFIKRYFITSIPLIITEFVWVLGDSAFSAIYSRMGTDEFAAITITFPIQMLTIGFFTGLSTATLVMLGNKLGANEHETAYNYARHFIRLAFVATVVTGFFVILLSHLYVSIYNVAPDIQDIAIKILIIFGAILWVKVLNMTIGSGVLKSGGDTRYILALDVLGMWGIGVPLGLFGAFVLKLPIHFVYILVSLEEVVRLVLGFYRTYSKKWLNNVT